MCFFQLIKLVSELYVYQNVRCNDKKNSSNNTLITTLVPNFYKDPQHLWK